MGPYRVDSLKTLDALRRIKEGLRLGFSPVCFAESAEIQQVYKDWKKD